MLRNFSYLFLLMVAAIAMSCSQYRSITIENQRPAKVQIPDEIQSLTLMNRSLTPEFSNFDEDSLQRYFYRKEFQVNTNVLDSMASDTCLQVLGELLFGSGRFDIVIPVERNIPRDSKYYTNEQPLDWDYVDEVCKNYNTDALLVMEKYLNHVNTRFEAEAQPLLSDGLAYTYFYASYDVIYDSSFRIYYPAKKKIVGQFFISDTIFWENGDVDQQALFRNLGSIKKGLIATGIKVALDLDSYISPSWVPDKRGIFIIDKKNKTEQKLIEDSDWAGLAEYWQPLTETKNRAVRSKAEFNMSFASELDGRVDDAIAWASKSYQTLFRNQTEGYLKKLERRRAELLKQAKNKTTGE